MRRPQLGVLTLHLPVHACDQQPAPGLWPRGGMLDVNRGQLVGVPEGIFLAGGKAIEDALTNTLQVADDRSCVVQFV